jgi:hypothetical protein
MLGRRPFFVSLLFAVLSSLMMLTGCPSFSTVEADIGNYVPFILQAVGGLLTIFDPGLAAIITPTITIVQASLAALLKVIADWKAADATQKPGIVGDIVAALMVVQTDLGNVLAAVKVNAPAAIYAGVLALVNIILGVIEGYINKLAPVSPTAAARRVQIKGASIVALNYDSSKFRSVWNAKCVELHWTEAQIK